MPNARVGAMPQMAVQQEQQASKGRCKHSKGITMEDLKYQTAMRLAQEQTRRTNSFSSNKKPVGNDGFLSSATPYHRKRSENTTKPGGSKNFSNSSNDNGIRSQNHMISNYSNCDRKNCQQSKMMDNLEYMTSPPHDVKGAFRHIRNDNDERRDMGPSEHFQQQVSHHYYNPTKSRPVYHSHEAKSQRTVNSSVNPSVNPSVNASENSSVNCKKQSSTKTYRHGLTVQELKEMTRSRLAAEANGDQPADEGSSLQRKPLSEPVRKGSLFQNIRERFNLDVSSKQKLRSSESMASAPSVGICPSNSFSCRTNNSQDGNVHLNQVTQQHAFPRNQINLSAQEPSHSTRIYQDNMGSLHSPYSQDAFENSSVHSFNSLRESDYLGSESSYFHSSGRVSLSSNLDQRSASFPTATEFGRTLETRDPRSNSNMFGGSVFSRRSMPSTPSPSEFVNSYENKLGQQHGSLTSAQDDVYCRILGQGSSETLPTINLSTDSYSDSDVPMSFGSSPTTNLSMDSYCDSEETDFVPLNFGPYDRNVSDGAFSRNGDLPNSVAESVLTPHINSLSAVFRDPQVQRHHTHSAHYSSVEPSYMAQDRYNCKSWDEPDDMSIAQFLDDFQTRLNVDSSTQAPSSSFFVSKIDPEVTKH